MYVMSLSESNILMDEGLCEGVTIEDKFEAWMD